MIEADAPELSEKLLVSARFKAGNPAAGRSPLVRVSHNSLRANHRELQARGYNTLEFCHVFDEESSQENVFTSALIPLAQSFERGANCNLLVYGPTGSGKTYTVQGKAL